MVVPLLAQVVPAAASFQTQHSAPFSTEALLTTDLEDSKLPYYTPELLTFLTENNYIQNGVIIKSIEIPPCSMNQITALFNLIESPFDLVDHNNVTVLKDLSGEVILRLLLENPIATKSNVIIGTYLSGGAVTTVIESDVDWMSYFVKSIVSEDHFRSAARYIRPFPKRKLPDTDIHIYCKQGSNKTRREILGQLLNSLADLIIKNNCSYIHAEIAYTLTLSSDEIKKDPLLVKVLDRINAFQEVPKDGPEEFLQLSFKSIVVAIIERNCLKKFPREATLIAFGRIEIFLTESPSYLLTPDKLSYRFDLISRTALLTPTCPDSVIHRICKIAYIDKPPSEYTLPKACTYSALGYHVNPDDKFKEALLHFIEFIYSKLTCKLTERGSKFLKKYERGHFQETPEEGICTLFALFQVLQKEHNYLIPLIIQSLNIFSQKIEEPLLNKLQMILLKYPKKFDLIESIFSLYPRPLGVENQNPIMFFVTEGKEQPYTLHFDFSPQDAVERILAADPLIVLEIVNDLFYDFRVVYPSSICHGQINSLEKLLERPNFLKVGFTLLLRTENPEKYLIHLPTIFATSIDDKLVEQVRERFHDSALNYALEEPICRSNLLFAVNLARITKCAEIAYSMWEKYFQKNVKESAEIANALLPHHFYLACKIVVRSLKNEYLDAASDLHDKIYTIIVPKLIPPIAPDIVSMASPILLWLIGSFLERNLDEPVNKLIESPHVDVKELSKVKANFWPLLSEIHLVECLIHASTTNVEGYTEGLKHFVKLKINENLGLKVVRTLRTVIPNCLTPNVENIPILNTIKVLFEYALNWSIENQKTSIPILYQFYLAVKSAHKKSKTNFFLPYLKSSIGMLLSHDPQQLFNSTLRAEVLAAELYFLLKDPLKPLEEFSQKLEILIPMLIKKLEEEQRQGSIEDLIHALGKCDLNVAENKEVKSWCEKLRTALPKTSKSEPINAKWKNLKERREWIDKHWCEEVKMEKYGTLKRTEIVDCFNIYFSLEHKITSKEVFKVLEHRNQIYILFEDHLPAGEAITHYRRWFIKICRTLENPDKYELTADELNILQDFKEEIIIKSRDCKCEHVENLILKSFIQFFSVSEDPEISLICWDWARRNIEKMNHIPERMELVESTLRNLLERSMKLAEIDLTLEDKAAITCCSGDYFRKFSNRKIPSELWLEGLLSMDDPFTYPEALAWAMITFQSHVKISNKTMHIIYNFLHGLLDHRSLMSDTTLKCVGGLLQMIPINNTTTQFWTQYIQILLNDFYIRVTPFTIENLCFFWNKAHALRIVCKNLTIKPQYIWRLFDLFKSNNLGEFGFLWNYLYINFYQKTYKDIKFIYSAEDCSLPVLKLPHEFMTLELDGLTTYIGELYKILDCCHTTVTECALIEPLRLYIYDIYFAAFKELLSIHINKHELTRSDLLAFFKGSLSLVKMREVHAFNILLTKSLPEILDLMIQCKIDIQKEDCYYKCFVRVGCKHICSGMSLAKVRIAAEELLNERYDFETKVLPVEIVHNIMKFFLEIDKESFEDFDEVFEFYLMKFVRVLGGLIACNTSFPTMKPFFDRLLEILNLPRKLTSEGEIRKAKFMNFILECLREGHLLISNIAFSYLLKLAVEKGFYINSPELLVEAKNMKAP